MIKKKIADNNENNHNDINTNIINSNDNKKLRAI